MNRHALIRSQHSTMQSLWSFVFGSMFVSNVMMTIPMDTPARLAEIPGNTSYVGLGSTRRGATAEDGGRHRNGAGESADDGHGKLGEGIDTYLYGVAGDPYEKKLISDKNIAKSTSVLEDINDGPLHDAELQLHGGARNSYSVRNVARNRRNATLDRERSQRTKGRSNKTKQPQAASVRYLGPEGYECLGMTEFVYEAKKTFPSGTIPTFKGERSYTSVLIDSKTSCNRTTLNVSGATVLDVTVETCCITNCNHTTDIFVSGSQHILLKFLKFNVPGLNLLRSEAFGVCDESLEVSVNNPPDQNTETPDRHVIGRFCGIKAPTAVFVEFSQVNLTLSLLDNKQCVDKINFVVEIVPCVKFAYNSCDSSEYVSLNPDSGYISSPGMSKGQNYPNKLECQWRITVPEDKLISLSAAFIELKPGDFIDIYTNKTDSRMFPTRLRLSDLHFRQPVILPSNTCIVKFHSNSIHSGVGFNISYEATNTSKFIPMFNNYSLDCSNEKIPNASMCNFHADCANGEDEKICYYKRPGCWPQGYAFKGHCYQLVTNMTKMSWNMAEEFCERNLSSHLVTLNTVFERLFIDRLRRYIGPGVSIIFLGLRRMRIQQVKQMYRRMWQWTDGSTAFYLPDEYRYAGWSTCALLHFDYFHSTECGDKKENPSFICERRLDPPQISTGTGLNYSVGDAWPTTKFSMFRCGSKEYISIEQRCDKVDNCYDHSDERGCDYDLLADTMFKCETSGMLAYSFVCDGIDGCPDSTDEAMCKTPDKASLGLNMTICTDGMLLEKTKVCDGREDCLDASDEEDCTDCKSGTSLCPMIACLPANWTTDNEIDCPIRDLKGRRAPESEFRENVFLSKPPPGVIFPDGYGKFDTGPYFKEEGFCPDTHVQCLEGYCIPHYMFCNGYIDCPNGEDENWQECEKQCANMYKCKYSRVCVHNENLCDGYYHCPNHDDETLCAYQIKNCPPNCTCVRMEITCKAPPKFNEFDPVPVRYIRLNDAHLPDLQFEGIASYALIYLNVSSSGVVNITETGLRYLNLKILDASNNIIEHLENDVFKHCPVLQTLILSSNRLDNENYLFLRHTRELTKLDLSYNRKDELEFECFDGAVKLQELTLRYMNIWKISDGAFKGLVALKRIDLKGNNIVSFTSSIFQNQKNLRQITTDNFRLCCDSVKPSTVQPVDCDAPNDEISSCADILRTLLLRASLWIMAVLTLTGNVGVIVYRIFYDRGLKQSFRIIITCLSASDLIMGVYLVIIGSADAFYRDRYLVFEHEWTSSAACQVAGFLCLLSSETSALFILLVTLDRLLAIAFPLHPHCHLNARSATVACGLVWIIGLVMAAVPLLPPFQHWELYAQKAVGVPLPITRSHLPGYEYSFGIFILFNMTVFLLVALGQLLIYLSVTLQKHSRLSEIRVRQDTAIAKRLILVVLTDCLCWFPITVMGLAARSGQPVPGEMNVVATVFLLPANSAFNPFLYTANAILLARRIRKKKHLSEAEMSLRRMSS